MTDDDMREVARTENFKAGDTACIRCGAALHLYFNGGELDSVQCCGLVYRTEVQRTDLVVYEKTPRKQFSTEKPTAATSPRRRRSLEA